MLAPLASSRGAETNMRLPTVAAHLGAVSSLHWQGALIFVCSRGLLWQRLKRALGPVPLWQRRLEHALGRLVLRHRVAPTPGLAFCPRLQRFGFCGRGFLSHAGELDAGRVFGGGRYDLTAKDTPPDSCASTIVGLAASTSAFTLVAASSRLSKTPGFPRFPGDQGRSLGADHPPPGSSRSSAKGRMASSVRYRGSRQCILWRQCIRQVGYRTQEFQAMVEQGMKARKKRYL